MGNPATLTLNSQSVAYGDTTASNNPNMRYFDWKRCLNAVSVQNPTSSQYSILPGVEQLIFDGTRTITADNTTTWAVTLSTVDSNTYRFTATGGAAPGLRTDRALTLNGASVTVAVLPNFTATLTTTVSDFTSVSPGDTLFIPGAATGDSAGPFNPLNTGYWVVLGVAGATVTLSRLPGASFEAWGEVVAVTANSQVQAFSSNGVQVGDKVDISSGFFGSTLKTFTVTAINAHWFEVQSTSPLAAQSGVTPGAVGIVFYTAAKRFLRIEADQECSIRLNGDTSNTNRLSPWDASNPDLVAEYVKVGPTWSLKVFNRSSVTLNVLVLAAE